MTDRAVFFMALCAFLGAAKDATKSPLKCLEISFNNTYNQMTFADVGSRKCAGMCRSSYFNDGNFVTYVLTCDDQARLCTRTGCFDDIGTWTKHCCCDNDNCVHPNATDPVTYPLTDLNFSVATAAYQIDDAVFTEGSGACVEDNLDITEDACKLYDYWKKEVKVLKILGVQEYSFSISWNQVLPDGYPSSRDQTSIDYYRNLITALKAANIKPRVTLFHWDLPQTLQNLGGWLSRTTVTAFGDYAEVIFQEFSDVVDTWITINEPAVITKFAYCGEQSDNDCEWNYYLVIKNLLLAHAEVVSRARKLGLKTASFGLALNGPFFYPNVATLPTDVEAAERAFQFHWGVFAHPVYSKEGNWPQVVIDRIEFLSNYDFHPRSRLPSFTPEEIAFVKGTGDFIGINYYRSLSVTNILDILPAKRGHFSTRDYDSGTTSMTLQHWHPVAPGAWIMYTPEGLRRILNKLKSEYGDYPMSITANGVMDAEGENLDDITRIKYIRGHLAAIAQAKFIDGVNVTGYTYWSLMDNSENDDYYKTRFGICRVDFDDPEQTSTPKRSFGFFKSIIKARTVQGFSVNSSF